MSKLPVKIHLMMVLVVCHNSFAYKMDDAATSLTALALSSFAGGNMSKYMNEAHWLIKIMKGGIVYLIRLDPLSFKNPVICSLLISSVQ